MNNFSSVRFFFHQKKLIWYFFSSNIFLILYLIVISWSYKKGCANDNIKFLNHFDQNIKLNFIIRPEITTFPQKLYSQPRKNKNIVLNFLIEDFRGYCCPKTKRKRDVIYFLFSISYFLFFKSSIFGFSFFIFVLKNTADEFCFFP